MTQMQHLPLGSLDHFLRTVRVGRSLKINACFQRTWGYGHGSGQQWFDPMVVVRKVMLPKRRLDTRALRRQINRLFHPLVTVLPPNTRRRQHDEKQAAQDGHDNSNNTSTGTITQTTHTFYTALFHQKKTHNHVATRTRGLPAPPPPSRTTNGQTQARRLEPILLPKHRHSTRSPRYCDTTTASAMLMSCMPCHMRNPTVRPSVTHTRARSSVRPLETFPSFLPSLLLLLSSKLPWSSPPSYGNICTCIG